SPFGVSAHAAVNILLALALPLAGISMWFAAGAVTRSVLLRGWAAVAWAFLPVLSLGLNHGRIASLVAHLLLPLLGLALARAFGVDQRDVIRSGMVDAGEGSSRRAIPVVSRSSGAGSAGAAAAAGLLLGAIALVGLFRAGVAGKTVRWGWFLTGTGLLTAVGAQHLLRSPQYDWLGSFQRLPEWAG